MNDFSLKIKIKKCETQFEYFPIITTKEAPINVRNN